MSIIASKKMSICASVSASAKSSVIAFAAPVTSSSWAVGSAMSQKRLPPSG
jgi:hypothetical protein